MTWQLIRYVIPPVFAVYPTVQTNAILLYYNALTFVCYIPLLVALIVFYRYTALSYIDVCELTQANIRTAFDGNLWIMTKRHKTNVASNIRLLDVPKAILEKYKDQLPNGMILPIISNQKVNEYLKEIASICSINKSLTFHVARHSCATSVLIANGVPIETVSKILGHTNIRTTQIYARITDVKVSNDMELLVRKLDMAK